jgi:hypothetical protein
MAPMTLMGKTEGYSIRVSLRGSVPAGGVMDALMVVIDCEQQA